LSRPRPAKIRRRNLRIPVILAHGLRSYKRETRDMAEKSPNDTWKPIGKLAADLVDKAIKARPK